MNVAIGPKCIAVRTPAGIGMSFVTERSWAEAQKIGPRQLESAIRETALSVIISRYLEDSPLHAAVALAAINSLCIHTGGPAVMDWHALLHGYKKLGMVGYFCPLMDRIALTGITTVIFELRDIPGTLKPEEAPALLPSCDVVLITGASFANKTIHQYIPHVAPAARAFIIGYSTPLAGFLLERFTLGSSRVDDWEPAATCIRAGGGIRDMHSYVRKVIRRSN